MGMERKASPFRELASSPMPASSVVAKDGSQEENTGQSRLSASSVLTSAPWPRAAEWSMPRTRKGRRSGLFFESPGEASREQQHARLAGSPLLFRSPSRDPSSSRRCLGARPRQSSYILAGSSVLPRDNTILRKWSPLARVRPPCSSVSRRRRRLASRSTGGRNSRDPRCNADIEAAG